jgi:hypothetical protein
MRFVPGLLPISATMVAWLASKFCKLQKWSKKRTKCSSQSLITDRQQNWVRYPGSQKREGWGAKVIDRLANDFSGSFRSSPVTPLATSNICAPSPKPDRTAYARNYFKPGRG